MRSADSSAWRPTTAKTSNRRLPQAPQQGNGKRVALIGAGCASLAVANDLAPLGYDCVIFEALDQPGGLMRTNIPAFRLPAPVLDEEIGYIVNLGVDLRLSSPVASMRELLGQDFDAVFVGSGAPKGKDLDLPGRHDADRIHIGIEWLGSIAFGHVEKVGERVLIIGVGNTAMDCCRSSLRLGAKDVKVMARKPRQFFKASDWELEDAEEERVEIVVNHSPKAFVVENGKLVGMRFDELEYDVDERGRILSSRILREVFLPCDDVVLAIGQDNAFPWIERDIGIDFDEHDVPVVDPLTFQATRPGVFFGGDAAFGPKNIIWAVEHGHQAAISIHKHCTGADLTRRLPRGVNLSSAKMGIHEWSYSNDYDPAVRRMMPHVDLKKRFKKLNIEVELGFTAEQAATEVERCLNCDLQTVFTADLCIECDACIDICPVDCLTIAPNGDRASVEASLKAPAIERRSTVLRLRAPQTDRARDVQGRKPLRALRALRGALSDRCVGHAEVERCNPICRARSPAGYGPVEESKKSRINDFVLKIANVNGTGSASANTLLMKAIFRMGVPVSGKNFFPSNIQGLPTWYEIRVSKDGYLGRSGVVDVMVAMNAQTYERDLAEVRPGGTLIYDSTWPRTAAVRAPRHRHSRHSASRACATSISRRRERVF